MVGIWETQQEDQLEQAIAGGFAAATDTLPDELPIETAPLVAAMQLENVHITGGWGNGTADKGDPVEVLLTISFQESAPVESGSVPNGFDTAAGVATSAIEDGVNGSRIEATNFGGVYGDVSITAAYTASEREVINLRIGRGEGNTVYDLTDGSVLELTGGGNILRRQPEQTTSRSTQEDTDTQTVDEQVDQAVTEIQQDEVLRRKYPEMPDPLVAFVDDETEDLEVPVGKKQTKTIERKEPYPFEEEMAEPGVVVSSDLNQSVIEGIGAAVASNFSSSVPASFPRTGLYIRNRLLNQGPAYILDLYRDLVYYSGFISSKYDYELRAGTYTSFREFIWRLNESPKKGGPELITPIPASEAEARDLSTMPVIETSDGEMEAPWLERRQYYEINEDEADNMEVWTDVTKYLYEVLDE